jgi:hypothetical protein
MHFDGERWSALALPPGMMLLDLMPLERGVVWAYASLEDRFGAVVLRWAGERWERSGPAIVDRSIYVDRLVRAGDDVWIASVSDMLHLVDDAWTPIDDAPSEGVTLYGAGNRGVARVRGAICREVLPIGEQVFCLTDQGRVLHAEAGATPVHLPIDPYGATLAPALWDRVSPALWAGETGIAWGSDPSSVLRFRVLEAPPSEPWPYPQVLERWSGERFEAVRAPSLEGGVEEDVIGRHGLDLDGAEGVAWAVVEGRLLRVIDRRATPVALPAELEDVRLAQVAAIDRDRAVLLGTREDPWESLVVRYDGGRFSVELRADATAIGDLAAISGIDVDRAGDTWAVGAIGRFEAREPRAHVLLRERGGAWERWEIGEAWFYSHLVVDGDDAWLVANGCATRFSLPGDGASIATAAEPAPGARCVYDARLWVGESGAWLTSSTQALWLPR